MVLRVYFREVVSEETWGFFLLSQKFSWLCFTERDLNVRQNAV